MKPTDQRIERYENRLLAIGMMLFFALLLWVFNSGCYSEKRATRQVVRAQATYPSVVAGNCGEWYPPLESTKEVVKYKPGIPVVGPTKYVTVDCDSVVEANKGKGTANQGTPSKRNTVTIPCPPDTTRVDTFDRLREEVKHNKGALTACQDENQKLLVKASQLQQSNDNKSKWLWILGGIIGLYLIGKFVVKRYFRL